MGANGSTQVGEYAALLKDFEVTRRVETEGLLYLRELKSKGEYLLREFTFNDRKEFQKCCELLEKKRQVMASCKFLAPLERIVSRTEDQYCSTFFKLYALFQFNDRTLDNEANERKLQKRSFQETELWSILASCILALSHLQRNGIRHESLRSSSILISKEGVVKVYDPVATGCQTNYDTLLTRRSTPHIYLSPELADCLHQQSNQQNVHPYKSDIFTLGVIILQAGLLQYQDECYRDDSARVHWETVQYNIHRFKQIYSEDLTGLIELMLCREEKSRPDWMQLEERVIKEEENKAASMLNVSQQKGGRGNQVDRARMSGLAGQKFVKSQAISDMSMSTPRHTHLYRPRQTVSNVPNYQPPAQMMQPLPASDPRYVYIAPSIIDFTRPLKSVFPSSVYSTSTKTDENLIIVTEDQKLSEMDTPNHRNSSTYFQSSFKPVPQSSQSAGIAAQNTFYNTFTPNQPVIVHEAPPTLANTYGVSYFRPEVPQVPVINPAISSSPPEQPSQGEYVVQRYKQGSEYKGYKMQGMRHGVGTFYYQDGGMYEGQWRFNKMQGEGKLFYQSGKLAYEGHWSQDQFSGRGTLYNQYPDVLHEPLNYKNLEEIQEFWTKYEGQFKEDLKNGRGTLFLSNGEYYEGEFAEDMANGSGTFVRMNGERVVGKWLGNLFVG